MGHRNSVGTLLVLILTIGLSLTACTGSQDALADAPVPSPTPLPSATPGTTPSATPTPVVPRATVSPTAPVPLFPDVNNIGSDWEVEVSDPAEVGEQKTYSHYPPASVQYDELFVDDALVAVDYICGDETQDRDLMGWFSLVEEDVDGAVSYKSWPIDFFRQGCRIDITVENTEGATLGLRFVSHCPTCHN